MTRHDALRRYPRIIAHLVCESLGYMSVLHAANALLAFIEKRPHYCEWYDHMAGAHRDKKYEEAMNAVTQETVRRAIERRHQHRGYMASYPQAVALVKAELAQQGVTSQMLASWF